MNEVVKKPEITRTALPRLDFTDMPSNVALLILAEELRRLAESMPLVRDLTCDLRIDKSGSCALYFRACYLFRM